MKKRLLTLALAVCLAATSLAVPASAADTNSSALQTIQALGIIKGDENGDLTLDSNVTRAQFVTMMARASSYKDSIGSGGAGYSLFKDVKSSHWASEYIGLAVQEGWASGYSDGTFRPNSAVTLEEACTMVLRLLGYDSSALTGSFPSAQLNKANALGLRDKISVKRGGLMTRRDCVQLFYNLMTAQNSSGQTYAATLGYTVTDGQVDYLALVTDGIKGPYTAPADGAPELPFTPETFYYDGTLSAVNAVKQYDIYYYNENIRTVWVYNDRVTGMLSAVSPNQTAPESVTVAGQSYQLENSAVSQKVSRLDEDEVVTLLLGMSGQVADVLQGVQGELDGDAYLAAVNSDTKGPYIAAPGTLELPFDTSKAKVYRNGSPAGLSSVQQYDVYYYNPTLQTVWLYTKRVAGRISALSPGSASPTSVTVAGTAYEIEDSAAHQFSALKGGPSVGTMVTLLLGMDDVVAGVLTGDEVDMTYYGVVQSCSKGITTKGNAAVETALTIICTDGAARTFAIDKDATYTVGRLVSVNSTGDGILVKGISEKSMSGGVNRDATKFGDYYFADNVNILDTSDEGDAVAVDPKRLAGCDISSSDVRYYTLNGNKEIEHLILNNTTGDTWTYAYMTSIEDLSAEMSITVNYEYLINGTKTTTRSSGTKYPVETGGMGISYKSDGSIKSMRQMSSVRLTSLSTQTAVADNRKYALADEVQVYLRKGGEYYLTTISAVNAEDYILTGWYDTASGAPGGRIRIMIATGK